MDENNSKLRRPNLTKGRFFLSIEDFHGLPSDQVLSLQADYDLTFEQVDHSALTRSYWTYFGEMIAYGNAKCPSKPRFETEHPTVVVFRPKGFSHPMTSITDTILDCPFSKVTLYPADNETSRIAKYRNSQYFNVSSPRPSAHRIQNKVIVSIHTVTYVFPELSPLEKDYIQELFHLLKDQVYQEQEEVAASMKLSQSRMPTNQLIGRFVTEMALEQHDDKHYLTFTYEERGKVGSSKSPILPHASRVHADVPLTLEIFADVPMEDDDDLDSGDKDGVVIEDEPRVRFALILEMFSPESDSSPDSE